MVDPVDVSGGFAHGESLMMLCRALNWPGLESVERLVLIGCAHQMAVDFDALSEWACLPVVFVAEAIKTLREMGALSH